MKRIASTSSSSRGLQHALPIPRMKQHNCSCSTLQAVGKSRLQWRRLPLGNKHESKSQLSHCQLSQELSRALPPLQRMRMPATTASPPSQWFASAA
jgi:hypothetical protein